MTASAGVNVWSKTASSNNTADSAVNWQEGQAPSSVNDSARGMMASTAKWRDDNSGSLATTGTSTAYVVTTNQNFAAKDSSLVADYTVAFQIDENCGTPVTLAVDGLAAKPLRSAAGVELASGALKAGAIYSATYKTSNSGEWILQNATPTILADSQVATAKIADGAVTYAKMQDVSATSRILGRKTSGAGDPEELTLSEALDFVGSATRGDILIRGASSWTRLAIGAAGTVISSDGTDASWGLSPALSKIGATQTASNSTAIAFTSGIDSTYREYQIGLDIVRPVTADAQLIMEVSTDGGSNWKTTSYLGGPWAFTTGGVSSSAAITTAFPLTRAAFSNSSDYGYSGRVNLHAPSSTGYKEFLTQGGVLQTGNTVHEWLIGAGVYNGSTSAINAVRFRFSTGNIAAGNFTLYGLK